MPQYVQGSVKKRQGDQDYDYDQIDTDRPLPPATLDYLSTQTLPGDRDNALFRASCQLRDAGFSQAEAESHLSPCGVRDGFTEAYCKRKIRSAYSKAPRKTIRSGPNGETPDFSAPPSAPRSTGARNGGEKAKEEGAEKPEPLPALIPDGARLLIETLFADKDRIAIGRGVLEGDDLHPDVGKPHRKQFLAAELAKKDAGEVFPYQEGVYFRVNSMRPHGSTDKDVTNYRYTLVEFDSGSKELQYSRLIHSPFPIAAIIDTGHISIHGCVILDAADAQQYAERRAIVDEYFSQFPGYDGSTKNPSRYSRLPGVDRYVYDKKKGCLTKSGRQELLALSIGPTSWDQYEKGQQKSSQAEAEELDRNELERILKEEETLPDPMDEAAFYGIAGEIIRIMEAGNEPCRESLLGHFLVGIGNIIGSNVSMDQGGDQHLNEFALFVGSSSLARKGTAWNLVRKLLVAVDPSWSKRIRPGLQSGEAIIHAIRDPNIKGSGKHAVNDPGVSDKRLLIIEPEQTRFLTVGQRRGNNLFDVVHDCWDSVDPLCCDSKTAAECASKAHVSMIGHTTRGSYLRHLPEEEKTNGSVNRSLIIAVYRAKKVARPQKVLWAKSDIVSRLRQVLSTFTIRREMDWSQEAAVEWQHFYDAFESKTKGGMVSSILDRLPAHVVRLSMIYCALDNWCLIKPEHLQAAIAFVDYCKRGAEWLFGVATGNQNADKIYKALQRHKPGALTRTEITNYVFRNHISAVDLDDALELLVRADLVRFWTENTPNRRFIRKWSSK